VSQIFLKIEHIFFKMLIGGWRNNMNHHNNAFMIDFSFYLPFLVYKAFTMQKAHEIMFKILKFSFHFPRKKQGKS
jgi:hypothetical protein